MDKPGLSGPFNGLVEDLGCSIKSSNAHGLFVVLFGNPCTQLLGPRVRIGLGPETFKQQTQKWGQVLELESPPMLALPL